MALSSEDKKEVQAAIDDAIATVAEQMGETAAKAATAALKPVTEQLTGLSETVKGLTAGGGKKTDGEGDQPLTIAQYEAMRKADADAAAKKTAEIEAAEAAQAARKAYIEKHAAKLPGPYQALIDGADEAALKAATEKAFETYRADAKTFGWKLGEAGVSAAATDAKTDAAGLSPRQKMEQGFAAGEVPTVATGE